MPSLLFICTGNATRSVIAGELAALARPDWRVATAGTLVVEGLPMSWRTRRAFDAIGVAPPDSHRSLQMTDELLAAADLVVALATEHVIHVRRNHPHAAARTGTLKRILRDLPVAGDVAALHLEDAVLDPTWEDVVDPGGGEVEDFVACAHEIDDLMRGLPALLDPAPDA